ncbi:hypothetical protein OEZ85_014330 [Tetradesmus obliquus]|uniref:RING-type domain-containing protein n=1 Tax=Tetradesmus obliquus TaxID=3088 RepID=A0ABY8UAU7_TETOB|nr:hypothetical protein OEZ85_014330 [Tetradesmus obliquus]
MASEAIESALYALGKELTCSICLSIMHQPCARLACCHYFCRECIQQSLRVKAACPICKSAAHRRDVFEDAKLDRIIALYGHLEAALGQQLLCSQLPDAAVELTAVLQQQQQQQQLAQKPAQQQAGSSKSGQQQQEQQGGCRIADSWSSAVTHVVCATNEKREARRTLKYMQGILSGCWVVSSSWGILSGCWVVSSSWVSACLDTLAAAKPSSPSAAADTAAAAAAALVAEAPHEVLGDSSGGAGGPGRGRARAVEGAPALLQGQQVFVAGSGSAKESCAQLNVHILLCTFLCIYWIVLLHLNPPAHQG